MRKKEMEKRIKGAFSSSVPDVLDDILKKCEEKKGFGEEMGKIKEVKSNDSNENKKKFVATKILAMCAVVMVAVVGFFGISKYNNVHAVDSIIEFDVNPSVELKVNKDEEIIEAVALNEDGKAILEGMDLEDVDLDVAVNAIVGSMIKNGYLSIDENSILVSVKNKDAEKGSRLQEEISDEISEILKNSAIDGSVMTQSYEENDEVKEVAEKNNISEGKAKLINSIVDLKLTNKKGEAYTEESLAKLSINDLNVLLSEKEVEVKNVSSKGTASEKSYIGKEKAKSIAISDAKVSASNIYNVEVELDCDDGKMVYELEFDSKTKSYEYEIDAKSGKIINKESETNDDYIDDDDDDDNNRTTTKQTTNKTNSNKTTSDKNNSQNSTTSVNRDDDDDRYDDNDDDDDDRYDDDDDDRYDDNDDDDDDDDDNDDDDDDDDDNDDDDDD